MPTRLPRRASSRVARLFLETSLLLSSRPVLILPPSRRVEVGRRVVIGWDQTKNAMRAVVAALPILRSAEAVSIVTSGVGKRHGAKAGALVRYLKAWGIKPSVTRIPELRAREIEDIDAHLQEQRADLLVIGSHGKGKYEGQLGSTGTKLVRSSPASVLVIRRPQEDFA